MTQPTELRNADDMGFVRGGPPRGPAIRRIPQLPMDSIRGVVVEVRTERTSKMVHVLLTEGELDKRLFAAAPEEYRDASKRGRREFAQLPHAEAYSARARFSARD